MERREDWAQRKWDEGVWMPAPITTINTTWPTTGATTTPHWVYNVSDTTSGSPYTLTHANSGSVSFNAATIADPPSLL